MRPTIVTLRQFYSSQLGRKVKQRLRQLVLDQWPEHADQVIVGIGYAPPVLRVLERGKPAALVALMPADQGAIYWPVHSENHSVLADEMMPPFAAESLHRVVALHAFEYLGEPLEMLQVYWQMLAPGGRIIVIVPNRRGYWASLGNTPFSRGTPYSIAQVKELLAQAHFTLRDVHSALFAPPSAHAVWMALWQALEIVGRICFPSFGGVLVVEAEKQIYAGVMQPVPVRSRKQKWAAEAAPV